MTEGGLRECQRGAAGMPEGSPIYLLVDGARFQSHGFQVVSVRRRRRASGGGEEVCDLSFSGLRRDFGHKKKQRLVRESTE